MNFHTRLLLCALLPAMLFIAALGVSLGGLLKTQTDFDEFIRTEEAAAIGLGEMYTQGLQMGQALRNIVLDPANKQGFENFNAAAANYEKAQQQTADAARGTSLAPRLQQLVPLREAQEVQQQRVLEMVKSDRAQAAELLNSAETPAWRSLRGQLLKEIAAGRKLAAEAQQATQQRARHLTAIAVALAVAAAAVSAALVLLMRRTVRRELGADPGDVGRALQRLADGDLTSEPAAGGLPQGVMAELERARHKLRELVSHVQRGAESINTASSEIAMGNQDLSVRTEQTASNLQRAASSMSELTGTVRQSADSARQANQLATSATEVALRGGSVVSQVVSTMGDINTSSKKIADIIGVIDGIAFQTNILALNAAVEAARAGEQGRGFAVVAGEVRSLAQRSAQAAREIKGLIGASVDKVEFGSALVADAGATMQEIVASVQRVTDIIGEITAATSQQSGGIGELDSAVNQLDEMTQRNAALVEESAAAAQSLKQQADQLSQVVGVFRLQKAAVSRR